MLRNQPFSLLLAVFFSLLLLASCSNKNGGGSEEKDPGKIELPVQESCQDDRSDEQIKELFNRAQGKDLPSPWGRPEIEAYLSTFGNLDLKNGECQSILQLAIQNGQSDLALELIDHGVDLEHQDLQGEAVLHYGARFCQTQVVEQLLTQAIDFEILNLQEETPLMVLAHCQDRDASKAILDAWPDPDRNINTPAKSGMTALMIAASRGHAPLTEWLINRKSKLDLSGPDAMTALMYSGLGTNVSDSVDSLKLLIKAGAKFDRKTAKDKMNAQELVIHYMHQAQANKDPVAESRFKKSIETMGLLIDSIQKRCEADPFNLEQALKVVRAREAGYETLAETLAKPLWSNGCAYILSRSSDKD